MSLGMLRQLLAAKIAVTAMPADASEKHVMIAAPVGSDTSPRRQVLVRTAVKLSIGPVQVDDR